MSLIGGDPTLVGRGSIVDSLIVVAGYCVMLVSGGALIGAYSESVLIICEM